MSGRRSWEQRLDALISSRWFFTASCCLLLGCSAYRAVESAYWLKPWPDVRLAPTFAIWKLGELYARPADGGILCTLYPPLAYLFYLPATLFSSPAGAVIAASSLSILGCLGVVAWASFGGQGGSLRGLVFLFLAWHLYTAQSLEGAWTNHADAPAYVFGVAACLLALRGGPVGCALAASAAVWSKQTAVPLFAALAAFYWVRHKRSEFWKFATTSLVVNLALAAGFAAWFGADRLWFGMFEMASRQPLNWKNALELHDIVVTSLDLAVIVALLLLLAAAGKKSIVDLAPPSAWLFIGAAAALAPLAVLGRVKVGGETNSYGMPHLWLMIGLTLALLHTAQRSPQFLPAIRLSLAAVVLMQMINSAPDLIRLPARLAGLEDSPEQRAYQFAKAHPGEVYFPWRPLASLMATGELHHAAYCVFDWEVANLEITDSRFRADLPANLRYVGFENFAFPPDEALMRRLPEFACQVELDELPGWTVFNKCE